MMTCERDYLERQKSESGILYIGCILYSSEQTLVNYWKSGNGGLVCGIECLVPVKAVCGVW